jgi:hypothetical protein
MNNDSLFDRMAELSRPAEKTDFEKQLDWELDQLNLMDVETKLIELRLRLNRMSFYTELGKRIKEKAYEQLEHLHHQLEQDRKN